MMSLKIYERGGYRWYVWPCPSCPARMASLSQDVTAGLREKHLAWHKELRKSSDATAAENERPATNDAADSSSA